MKKSMILSVVMVLGGMMPGSLAWGENGKVVKGEITVGTAYETGVLGKGIVIGRMIKKEKVRIQQDEQTGYLTLSCPYGEFDRVKTGAALPGTMKVYKEKEGVAVDNTSYWRRDSLPTRLATPLDKLDQKAVYFVDYQVLNYLSFSIKELAVPAREGTVEMFFHELRSF